MVAAPSVSPASSRSPSPELRALGAPQVPATQLTPNASRGVDITAVNHDALTLLGRHKPSHQQAMRKPALRKPKPAPPPLPSVDPNVALAFEAAGLPMTHNSLGERAARAITQTLRDIQRGHMPTTATPVPFHQPIEAAYGAAHKAAMNNVCYDQLADIRDNLANTLQAHCDQKTAEATAALARPVVVWNNGQMEHGWDVDLQSGGFINALWSIVGGRNNATLPKFHALLSEMSATAREPIDDTLFASEERFRNLVDNVAAIIVEAQPRA